MPTNCLAGSSSSCKKLADQIVLDSVHLVDCLLELALDTQLNDEQRDYLQTSLQSAESLLTLLNDILDFSKIEAGRLELETINFDLRSAVEDVAYTLAKRAQDKGLEMACLIHPDLTTDLPHDFSEPALEALDAADVILMVATPDMASIRAVTAALDTYDKLGYPKEKRKLILNAIFPHSGLTKDKIESALGLTSIAMIPYVQDVFVDAINLAAACFP